MFTGHGRSGQGVRRSLRLHSETAPGALGVLSGRGSAGSCGLALASPDSWKVGADGQAEAALNDPSNAGSAPALQWRLTSRSSLAPLP